MDFGHFSADSSFSARKSHGDDSIDIREIKQLLLSGDNDEIAAAASRVLSLMNNSENVVQMITSDISEFLCDAMPPFDSFLTSIIYKCLEIMIKCEYFYCHNHSSSAVDTVIRSLHFLIKSNIHDSSVDQSMCMLKKIVSGYADNDMVPEKKTLENLVSLILALLKRDLVSDEVILQSGYIIKALFYTKFWTLHYVRDFHDTLIEWFDRVCVKKPGSLTEEIVVLGCALSAKNFRYTTENEDVINAFSDDLKSDQENLRQSNLIDNVIYFLTVLSVPHIKDSPLAGDQNEVEKLENYFTPLCHIFKELFPQRFCVAQKLSELGFLQFLTKVLSQVDSRRYDNLGKTCVTLLFEMIATLSDDVFQFPEMWPSGRDHFRKEVLTGMSLLPRDASHWTNMLTDTEVNRSSRLALIIYFYFHLLTVKSPLNTGSIYPSITRLMNTSFGMSSSPLLIKAIWFIYVMCEMSNEAASPGSNRCWALKKLLEVVETHRNISAIYTHHPAILYWAFSSPEITYRIQCEVIRLWLENRSPDCTVLDELVKESADARSAIFEVLQSGYEHVAHLAFSTLKTFMLQSQDENLSCNIWFLLPQTLAKYVADASTVVNVDYIVELATLRIPQEVDTGKIIRVASLLPEALEKSDLISLSPALKLSLQLLRISVEHDDSRVLFAFMRFEGFARKLLSGMELDASETVSTSLEIFIILWKRKLPAATYRYKPFVLKASVVLKILNGCDLELVNTALVLLEQMLDTEFKSDVIAVDEIPPHLVKIIFFDLENILIRYVPTITGHAWTCLKHCLLLSDAQAEDVLLTEVVKCGLPHLKDVPEMAELLTVWIRQKIKLAKLRGPYRSIGGRSYFLETIRDLSESLAKHPCDEFQDLTRSVLECCERLSIDMSIEPFATIRKRTGSYPL